MIEKILRCAEAGLNAGLQAIVEPIERYPLVLAVLLVMVIAAGAANGCITAAPPPA